MATIRYNALTIFCISGLKRPNLSVTFCVIENNLQKKLLATNFFSESKPGAPSKIRCFAFGTGSINIPAHLAVKTDAMIDFNPAITDAAHDLVCCYKPHIAYYSSQSATIFTE